jgi:hypothetical protein
MACKLLVHRRSFVTWRRTLKVLEDSEVLALLFPEPAANGKPATDQVMVVVKDAQGEIALHTVVPDKQLLRRARVTGRYKSGTPIIDPTTREIIGYELAPIAVA